MKPLNLQLCTDNKQVLDIIKERVLSISCEELIKEVEKSFIFMRPTIKAIYIGLSTGLGIYISGPSGVGKSSIVKHILNFYGIPYYTISGHKDMPVDALLGVPNLNKLLKKSEYAIKFKNSVFAKPGIFIGEEFSHVDSEVASSLKDIITEKGYRYKDTFTPSLISSMIIIANKRPEEIADDEGKRAFYMERFPVRVHSTWDKYSAFKYKKFITFLFPDLKDIDARFLAQLFEDNFLLHNNWISPRHIIDLTSTYISHGSACFESFNINIDNITELYMKTESLLNDTIFKGNIDSIYKKILDQKDIEVKRNMVMFVKSKLDDILTTDTSTEYFKLFKAKIDVFDNELITDDYLPEIQMHLKMLL